MSKVTFDFIGETFVVTGASSGIGRQVALELAEAGAVVLALARRQERLDELRGICPERIVTAAVDVCERKAVEKAVLNFVAEHGRLSGSVHAAGLSGLTPLKLYDRGLAERIMRVSFWAGVDLLQIVTRKRCSREGAGHVLFSSISSIYSAKGMLAYNAAKAAVVSAVRTSAKEVCPRNRVNAVLPGWVKSEMTASLAGVSDTEEILSHELLGEGKPGDVTGLVKFLLSGEARWMTGAAIPVDGGFLA